MITPFYILFAFGLFSLMLHRTRWLKPFALLGVALTMYLSFMATPFLLFEFVLGLVLFALLLHEDDEITMTQILFIGAASFLLMQSESVLEYVISFEALSIISVVLVSQIHTKEQAEGAVKMFMAAGLATGILFLGLLFYVMGGGMLQEPVSAELNVFGVIGVAIMLAGIFYKLTIVPFHGWAADTYALIRHSHAAILSGLAKSVVALVTFKIFSPYILENLDSVVPVLVLLSIVTMTLGNFLALKQKRLSKILSYSSIAHAGYILLAFAAVSSSYAYTGILYMSIAYIFMQSAAFLALSTLQKHYTVESLDDLRGFSVQNPLLAFFFSVQLLSLAGIPLLAGFLAKAVVFYAGVDAGLWYVVLIALLNSALSVGYYAWIIKVIYFDAFEGKKSMHRELSLSTFAQVILLGGTLYFGIFAGTVF